MYFLIKRNEKNELVKCISECWDTIQSDIKETDTVIDLFKSDKFQPESIKELKQNIKRQERK